MNLLAPDPSEAGALYANIFVKDVDESEGLYRSGDGGKTWEAVNVNLPVDVAVQMVVSADLMALRDADGELFFSVDDAQTWQPLTADCL